MRAAVLDLVVERDIGSEERLMQLGLRGSELAQEVVMLRAMARGAAGVPTLKVATHALWPHATVRLKNLTPSRDRIGSCWGCVRRRFVWRDEVP